MGWYRHGQECIADIWIMCWIDVEEFVDDEEEGKCTEFQLNLYSR
jgi:hypothetical protein